ncbi:MAG TPA: ABC transporter ATP-binding protein [Candidatus Dormibacteraeota bacterium]|nr:ABC transporter ATP-binding protein [Candidatus Dormibacteraeota bacterium]
MTRERLRRLFGERWARLPVVRDWLDGRHPAPTGRAPGLRPTGVGATLWRYRAHLRPVRTMMAAGLAASVLTAVALWAAPWPLKFVFDSVIGHHRLPTWLHWLPGAAAGRLTVLVGALLGIAAVQAVADYLANRWVATAGQRVIFGLRCQLFDHLEAQSLRFHQGRRTGDLLARLGGDIQAIQSAMVTAVPTLVRNVLTLVGMVTIMLILDWRYTLLALALVPALYLVTRHYLRRITALQRRGRRADGEASSVAQEVLTAITVVQAFGAERVEAERYARATRRGLEQNRQAIVAQSEFTPLMTLAMTASTAVVIFFGAQAVLQRQLTIGLLLVFMAYLRGMYSPVRQLAKLAGVVGRAQAAAERVTEILETADEVPNWPGARRIRRARGELALVGVHFAYPQGPPLLRGVDLVVPAGSQQALVGVTGSGKSTLVRLIPRFLDPIAGSLRLDGVDLRDLALADLRRQVALVPQEPVVFHGTVLENILYGHPRPDRALAVAAARAAGVEGVIEALRDGYDTVVGERGSTLSGGQRQCLAVARAMARNAPVLLLDEPTVGMDAELESVLLAALDRLAEGRTTITVSHQLWGLRQADQIAVLVDGRIAETGTHESLLRAGQTYSRLQGLQGPVPVLAGSAPGAGGWDRP